MTRDFENFLLHFSKEIENARVDSSAEEDGEILDRTIGQLMDLAERVYPDDVDALLVSTGIKRMMDEMKSLIELNMEHFQGFQLDPNWREFSVQYFGQEYLRPIFHLEDAMTLYFKTPPDSPEFYFLTAYLAKDDHFIIIQLYHFLGAIRH